MTDFLINHIVVSLPDSMSARRRILSDLLNCMPPKHPRRSSIRTMLTLLESHEQQQLEFKLSTEPLNGSTNHQ